MCTMNMQTKSVVALLTAAVLAVPVWAQVGPVNTGRVMDSNPMVGGGGSNQPVAGYVPAGGNALLTGGVAGNKGFQGAVPYGAANSFRGTLGSDALGNFDRRTSGNVPLTMGDAYRPYLNTAQATSGYVPMGQITANAMGGNTSAIMLSVNAQTLSDNLIPQASPRGVSSMMAPMNTGDIIGGSRILDGGAMDSRVQSAQASGLFGLRMAPGGATEKEMRRNDTGLNSEITPTVQTAMRGQDDPNSAAQRAVPGSAAQIDAALEQTGLNGTARTDDIYMRLQEQLRQAAGMGTAAGQKTTITKPEDKKDPSKAPNDDGSQVRLPGVPDVKGSKVNAGVMDGAAGAMDEAQLTRQLQAGRGLDKLQNLQVTTTTRFGELMKQGEEFLRKGKYVDAAQAYQNAAALEPTNALPIVGRAHALMGAGMYETAAFHLKALYNRQPTLMAVRYDLNAAFPADRIKELRVETQKLSQQKISAAAFVQAYLNYQIGSDDLAAGIQNWNTLMPSDPWIAIARKAWLDKPVGPDKP